MKRARDFDSLPPPPTPRDNPHSRATSAVNGHMNLRLPLAYGFFPTDEEIMILLRRFVDQKRINLVCPVHFIADIYSNTPDIISRSFERGNRQSCFFLSPRRFSPASREDRMLDGGFWKKKGNLVKIKIGLQVLGNRRIKEFYSVEQSRIKKTGWKIEEFGLLDYNNTLSSEVVFVINKLSLDYVTETTAAAKAQPHNTSMNPTPSLDQSGHSETYQIHRNTYLNPTPGQTGSFLNPYQKPIWPPLLHQPKSPQPPSSSKSLQTPYSTPILESYQIPQLPSSSKNAQTQTWSQATGTKPQIFVSQPSTPWIGCKNGLQRFQHLNPLNSFDQPSAHLSPVALHGESASSYQQHQSRSMNATESYQIPQSPSASKTFQTPQLTGTKPQMRVSQPSTTSLLRAYEQPMDTIPLHGENGSAVIPATNNNDPLQSFDQPLAHSLMAQHDDQPDESNVLCLTRVTIKGFSIRILPTVLIHHWLSGLPCLSMANVLSSPTLITNNKGLIISTLWLFCLFSNNHLSSLMKMVNMETIKPMETEQLKATRVPTGGWIRMMNDLAFYV